MKCPHCKYEDNGDIVDGQWVDSAKEHGDHFSISTIETTVEVGDENQSRFYVQPDIEAYRGYGYRRSSYSVYACGSCGILFINK